jgi:DNA-binding MarR family transcriptional regulator
METSELVNTWATLVQVKDVISKLRQKEIQPYNISPAQTSVLATLYNSPASLTPADISRSLVRNPSSITIILNRMAAKGLIIKASDKLKKNLIRVSLTSQGRKLYSQILKNMCIPRIMSNLSDRQRQQLKTALDILLDRALDELGERNSFKQFKL